MTMDARLEGLDWIAADWGTTRLRVWAMGANGRVLARAGSDRGMGQLDRTGYGPALLDLVGPWLADRPDPVAVLVCGMAGARSGWAEAAYRAVPCAPLDPARATRPDGADPRLSVLILPGLSQSAPPDVMRGEETQLAGLIAARPGWNGVACLPGTHSKWARIEGGRVTAFRTFMTGELYALLAGHSMLRLSVMDAEPDLAAFDAAAASGAGLADLFSVRAAGLLGDEPAAAAAGRLSGLLVGAEIAAAEAFRAGAPLALVGAPALTSLYARALGARDAGDPPLVFDGSEMALAGLTAARAALTKVPA